MLPSLESRTPSESFVGGPPSARRIAALPRVETIETAYDEVYFINRLYPGRVLHIDCGRGYLLSAIDSRWEKHGTESAPANLVEARRFARTFEGSVLSATYPEASFDAVLWSGDERSGNRGAVLQRVMGWLKPGGHLIIGASSRALDDAALPDLLMDAGFAIVGVEAPSLVGPGDRPSEISATFYCQKPQPGSAQHRRRPRPVR